MLGLYFLSTPSVECLFWTRTSVPFRLARSMGKLLGAVERRDAGFDPYFEKNRWRVTRRCLKVSQGVDEKNEALVNTFFIMKSSILNDSIMT